MNEKTIEKETTFSGVGLHSGLNVNITLKPSEKNGIIFKNNKNIEIQALYTNVVDTKLGTTIGLSVNNNIEKILTIEHLMAAIWAADIDHLIVEIDNQEIPILDGSGDIFLEEINKANIKQLNSKKKYLEILKEIIVKEDNKYIKILPYDGFCVDITVDFDYGNIGKQHFIFNGDKDRFKKDLIKSRTFCNKQEIEHMHSIGLAKGGSLENAMVFDNNGLINEEGFRFEDEVVKHKLLDCIGDMYTSGYNIFGKIESHKGGHTLNNILLKEIFSNSDNYKII